MNKTALRILFPGLVLFTVLGACGGGGDNSSKAAGSVAIAHASFDAIEGGFVNIYVSRSNGNSGALSVRYATTDGTAVAGADYAAASGTLTWPDEMSGTQTVTIAINDDNAAEALESFTLTLSNVSGGALGAISSATINIIDDDNAAVAAVGPITDLNSVTVNGIRYSTDAASVYVNGQPATTADLRLGQVVALRGDANYSNATGSADEIRYNASVIGPLENIDQAAERLIVMGQTVLINVDTVFAAGIDPDTLAGLTPGSTVQISGFRNADGDVLATRIETDATATDLQVTSVVSGLDQASLSFSMSRLVVDYSNAILIDLPQGMPANGMRVTAQGSLANGILIVSQITAPVDHTSTAGGRVDLAGIVTQFASSGEFWLNGRRVTTDSSTRFVNGQPSDLHANSEIAVGGAIDTDGTSIVAHEVTFGRPVYDRTTTAYDFENFTEVVVNSLSSVAVIYGAEYSVEVTAGSGALGSLQVTQEGDTVSLGSSNNQIFTAVITLPLLNRIEVGDNAITHVLLQDFDQAEMAIEIGGVSILRGEGMRIANLDATVTGVSFLNLGDIRPIDNASINISGVSRATLNMAAGASMTGSVRTGQGTGESRLFYYGTNVDVDVTTDSLSRVVRLGDTRP